jgi:hypothetical protein
MAFKFSIFFFCLHFLISFVTVNVNSKCSTVFEVYHFGEQRLYGIFMSFVTTKIECG